MQKFQNFNLGNIHEMIVALSIVCSGKVFYANNSDCLGRTISLVKSSMTGSLFIENDDEHILVSDIHYNETSKIFSKKTTYSYNKKDISNQFKKALDAYKNIQKTHKKTSSLPLPKEIKTLFETLKFTPKTATAQEKFDLHFVLKDNFDGEKMAMKSGVFWDGASIKLDTLENGGGRPTILNASGSRVSVQAFFELPENKIFLAEKIPSMRPQKLLRLLREHNILLTDCICSDFITTATNRSFSKAMAIDIFKAYEKGSEFKQILNFTHSGDVNNVKTLGNFLRDVAYGMTSTQNTSYSVKEFGHIAYLSKEGTAVLKQFNSSTFPEYLIKNCAIDGPSLSRHAPEGIIKQIDKSNQWKITLPFQIRIK